MKIERLKSLVKCDVASCRRKAEYTIVSGVSVSQNINLCRDCAVEIYEALGKILVPKSPQNMLNKSKSTIKGDAVTPTAEKENINGVSKGLKKKKEPTEER